MKLDLRSSRRTAAPTPASQKGRARVVGLIALALVGAAGAAIWLRGPASAPVVPAAAATPAAVALAIELLAEDVATVVEGSIERTLSMTGTLRALDAREIKSPLAGQVTSVAAREGEAVRRGQTLVTLDTTDLQARLRDRDAAVDAGQAQLALARKTQQNNQALLRQNFISQAAFDNASSGLDAAEAGLRSLQAQRDQAQKALADAVVRAPMDGIVAQRSAEPGLSVPVNATLLTLQDLSVMELEALVPTGQIPLVRVGQAVSFSVEGFDGQRFAGQVDRIAPSAEAGARSIAVYVRVANADRRLRGGMFAEGALVLERQAHALLMPKDALRAVGAVDHQVLRLADGHLALQDIKLGTADAASGRVEVLAGLSAGDRVVVGGASLRAGQPVRVVSVPTAAPATSPVASSATH